jgi:hypothetical protein
MHDTSASLSRPVGLLMGDLQSLASPDPLDLFVVEDPARFLQPPGDLAITVVAVLAGQCNDVGSELVLIITAARHLTLRRAMPRL